MQKLIIVLFFFGFNSALIAQNFTPEQYIERFKWIALEHQFEYKIPASITLAQGLLESGNGNSKLAVEGNNHFGIKCHSDWQGKKIYKDDDAKDECFRVYETPEESFNDHALFLSTRSRYAALFKFEIIDYESWAKGLKEAGYATDPNYPKRLIDLITKYKLDALDKITEKEFAQMKPNSEMKPQAEVDSKPKSNPSEFQYVNNVKCITVGKNLRMVDIARKYNVAPKKIYKYNDLPENTVIKPNTLIFLQPKRKRGDVKLHKVIKGETWWSISQQHGIRVSFLLKHNQATEDQILKVGQVLNLRKVKSKKK